MDCYKLRQQYIHTLYKEKAFCIKEEPFTLHHGGTSHLFLNHTIFLSKSENLSLLSEIYKSLIPKDLINYKLVAVDSVMSPVITGILSFQLNKDLLIVKEKKLEHGLQNKIYGDVSGGEVVLVDDVTSTGTILINATNELRNKGLIVNYALLSACRDDKAIENLKNINITPLYITTYEEIIIELWNTLTNKEKQIVKKEVSDKGYLWNLRHNCKNG